MALGMGTVQLNGIEEQKAVCERWRVWPQGGNQPCRNVSRCRQAVCSETGGAYRKHRGEGRTQNQPQKNRPAKHVMLSNVVIMFNNEQHINQTLPMPAKNKNNANNTFLNAMLCCTTTQACPVAACKRQH